MRERSNQRHIPDVMKRLLCRELVNQKRHGRGEKYTLF